MDTSMIRPFVQVISSTVAEMIWERAKSEASQDLKEVKSAEHSHEFVSV
jgi:hypothetical protein